MPTEIILEEALGPMRVIYDEEHLLGLDFASQSRPSVNKDLSPLIEELHRELAAYFAGHLKKFNIPLKLEGTPFQLEVWQALQAIPYGQTVSYADIAHAIRHPKAYRAVGLACHRNPIAIIVPCHRVIGKNKTLVGYGGGLAMKQKLLALEEQKTSLCLYTAN